MQVEDRALRDQRRELGAEAGGARRLVHDHDAAGLRHRRQDRPLVERAERADVDDLARRVDRIGGKLAHRHHRAVRDQRHVATLAGDARLAERHDVLALRHLAARRAVHELRLEHDDRIRVADRRREQSLRIRGCRRDRDLDAGRVHVVRLRRVVVQLGRAHAAAVRHANRERELHPAAGAPAVAADVRDQLVQRRVRERVVLHLDRRAASPPCTGQPRAPRSPPRRAACRRSGPRRSDPEAGGRAEHAAGAADVLAEHHDVLVARELACATRR